MLNSLRKIIKVVKKNKSDKHKQLLWRKYIGRIILNSIALLVRHTLFSTIWVFFPNICDLQDSRQRGYFFNPFLPLLLPLASQTPRH